MPRLPCPLFGLVLASCAVALMGCGDARHGSAQRPSVFLISVDTLRADHLGCYGYPRATSPNVDALAADGWLYENCLSHAPSTTPSCASLLSGFLPHETKMLATVNLPPELTTLPRILQAQGYTTLGVVSNFLLKSGNGWEQGFSVYDSQLEEHELVRGLPERTASRTTDRAIELLREHAHGPLFMWVHYQDPHGPYTPPQPYADAFTDSDREAIELEVNDGRSGFNGIPAYQRLGDHTDFHYYVSRYDAEIAYLDDHLGRLLREMRALGLYHTSVIVFTADHGEAMGENGYYFVHGEDLHISHIHVPLILKLAGGGSGRRSDFVQHLDILPTLLAILGLESELELRGQDLRRAGQPGQAILAEKVKQGAMRSLVRDGFRLVSSEADDRYRLYDLGADPGEEHDLAGDPRHAERLHDLAQRMRRMAAENALAGRALTTVDEVPSADESAKLRALGYVD